MNQSKALVSLLLRSVHLASLSFNRSDMLRPRARSLLAGLTNTGTSLPLQLLFTTGFLGYGVDVVLIQRVSKISGEEYSYTTGPRLVSRFTYGLSIRFLHIHTRIVLTLLCSDQLLCLNSAVGRAYIGCCDSMGKVRMQNDLHETNIGSVYKAISVSETYVKHEIRKML
jgi:hypothetical protein